MLRYVIGNRIDTSYSYCFRFRRSKIHYTLFSLVMHSHSLNTPDKEREASAPGILVNTHPQTTTDVTANAHVLQLPTRQRVKSQTRPGDSITRSISRSTRRSWTATAKLQWRALVRQLQKALLVQLRHHKPWRRQRSTRRSAERRSFRSLPKITTCAGAGRC